MAAKKRNFCCGNKPSKFNIILLINRLIPKFVLGSAPYNTERKADRNNLGTILLRICQAMIFVICVQSFKFAVAPDIHYSSGITFNFFNVEYKSSNANQLHIANMILHISLFLVVLVLLKKLQIQLAKYILLTAFCSYILLACLLWRYNLNLQYYFLLSMFISCYIFDKHEKKHLIIAISMQIGLFITLHQFLPPLPSFNNLMHANGSYQYLQLISQINAYVFALSCVICALYIRKILAHNWQILTHYEESQGVLLKKLFPKQLMPSLLMAQQEVVTAHEKHLTVDTQLLHQANPALQISQQMGVIFLDICQFTQLTLNKGDNDLSWQAIYQLFASYDLSISRLDAKRIKTNGDQYILLVGLHSQHCTKSYTAMQTLKACKQLLRSSTVNVKIGAAFGDVTCGVFDPNNPNFDIWGETVIRAARLESIAASDSILVDINLHTLTKSAIEYGQPTVQNLKGLGEQFAYSVPQEN